MKLYNSEIGNFIFSIFKYCSEYLGDELSQAEVTRLVMIATYVNYAGFLMHDNSKPVTKKHLQKILKLNRNTFKEFYNKLISLEILSEIEGKIYLSKQYFFKGDFSGHKDYLKDNNCVRIYINAIRFLYNNIDSRKHKQLGIVLKLIPHINLHWNILCKNPEEKDLNLVQKIKLRDVLEIMGYAEKYKFVIRRELLGLKLKDGSNIIAFVETEPEFLDKKVCINPTIIFGGSDVDNIYKVLNKYFEK